MAHSLWSHELGAQVVSFVWVVCALLLRLDALAPGTHPSFTGANSSRSKCSLKIAPATTSTHAGALVGALLLWHRECLHLGDAYDYAPSETSEEMKVWCQKWPSRWTAQSDCGPNSWIWIRIKGRTGQMKLARVKSKKRLLPWNLHSTLSV